MVIKMRWFSNHVENTNSYIAKDGTIFHSEEKAREYNKTCKINGICYANIPGDIQKLIDKYKIDVVHQYNLFTDEDTPFTLVEFEDEMQYDTFINAILMKHLTINNNFYVEFYPEYSKIGMNKFIICAENFYGLTIFNMIPLTHFFDCILNNLVEIIKSNEIPKEIMTKTIKIEPLQENK